MGAITSKYQIRISALERSQAVMSCKVIPPFLFPIRPKCLLRTRKPFPRTAIKKSEGEESSTERGARAEDSDDASSIAPSASASDAPSALVGKRRSLAERRRILEEDPAAGELRENEVFCSECKKWVKLSSRTKYEIKKWNTHIIRNHGRSIEDHANEMPSDRVREAERKLQLVNDPLVEDFTTKRVTCLKCQADIILHSSIPYQLDNWYTHKQTCSQGEWVLSVSFASYRRLILLRSARRRAQFVPQMPKQIRQIFHFPRLQASHLFPHFLSSRVQYRGMRRRHCKTLRP